MSYTSRPPRTPESWAPPGAGYTPLPKAVAWGMVASCIAVGILAVTLLPVLAVAGLGLLWGFRRALDRNRRGYAFHLGFHVAQALLLGTVAVYALLAGLWLVANDGWEAMRIGSTVAFPILAGVFAAEQQPRYGAWWFLRVGTVTALCFSAALLCDLLATRAGNATFTQSILQKSILALVPLATVALLWGAWRLHRQIHYKRLYRWCTYLAMAFVLLLTGSRYLYDSGYARRLPWGTWEYYEYSNYTVIPSDGSCNLKARVTEQEFMDFVAELGLKPVTGEEEISWGRPPIEATWWDCDGKLEGSYCRAESAHGYVNWWVLAKYQGGYLYLYESDM